MNQQKRTYETTFIINASLEDPQIETTIDHVAETIARNGGEITATNKWGRKRLAYPINKKNNGYYVNLEFAASSNVLPQLERIYQLDENILRFLTIYLDEKAIKARQQTFLNLQPEAISPQPVPVEREPLFEDDEVAPIPPKSI